MKYNIYYEGRLVRRHVDGEEVRKFMVKLSREEIKYVRLERIREEEVEEER